jgi:aminoglycoside phosphotransferase (APT) family kinase protein
VEPARGSRLPCNDLVHHDFNLSNILMHHGGVAGVVDWEAAGRGSRALDFATLLFEWHRLREAGGEVAPGGSVRLVEQILTAAGDAGLRLVVTYGAIARLALTSRRGQFAELAAWKRAMADLLDGLP